MQTNIKGKKRISEAKGVKEKVISNNTILKYLQLKDKPLKLDQVDRPNFESYPGSFKPDPDLEGNSPQERKRVKI